MAKLASTSIGVEIHGSYLEVNQLIKELSWRFKEVEEEDFVPVGGAGGGLDARLFRLVVHRDARHRVDVSSLELASLNDLDTDLELYKDSV